MPITRSVAFLFAAVAFFILAAISAQVGHSVGLTFWAWGFSGAAAYVAHLIP